MESPLRTAEANKGNNQRGAIMLEYMAAITFSFVFFIMMLQFIVLQYSNGVVRGALDEGVREGSRHLATTADCEQRVREVIGSSLGSASGVAHHLDCREEPGEIVATAQVIFPVWFPPGLDPIVLQPTTARAVKERLTNQ